MIIGPGGSVISETLRDEEGIIYADIDVEETIVPKQFHDVVGYYNRFDVFDLKVDNTGHEPLRLVQAFEDHTRLAGSETAAEDEDRVLPQPRLVRAS